MSSASEESLTKPRSATEAREVRSDGERSPQIASPPRSGASSRSPSSFSSASSSVDLQEQEGFADRNYMSAGDDSSVELNDPVEEMEFEPVQYVHREQLRSSGKSSNLTEKHLRSRIEETIQDRTPPLRVILRVQAAARMMIAKARLRAANRGVMSRFFIKTEGTSVKITVTKVKVKRTLKKNVTKTVTGKVRHNVGEDWERERETQERTQEIEKEEFQSMIQIEAENQDDTSNTKQAYIEESELLITPFLVDLLRRAITVEWSEERLITRVVYTKLAYA
jgi:hypothetical protein